MIIIKLILIICITQSNHAEFIQQQFRPFTPVWMPELPPCQLQVPPQHPHAQNGFAVPQQPIVEKLKPLRNSTEINFILPFLDIDIQIERSIHVMQESNEGYLFLLHGHELFQMFLGHQEKRISLMGYLEGSVKIMQPLAAKIISWQGHFLLVVALDEYLEVYQIRKDIMANRAQLLKDPRGYGEIAPVFQPIQQLTLSGRLQKLFLISTPGKEIMIITAVNFSKLHGKIRTFKWTKIGFETLQEMTVPAISFVNVIGSGTKYLITGKAIRQQAKTILSIYEINRTSLRLQNKQTLTIDSLMVHMVTFQKQNLIVACASKQSKSKSYLQMGDGYFEVFKERTAQEFAFDYLDASSRFIMTSRQNKIMIFTDHHLDCYGSFISDLTGISQLLGHIGTADENYVLLIYKTPFRLLIRALEIELGTKYRTPRATDNEGAELATQHKQVLISIAEQMKSFLPERSQNIFEKLLNPRPSKKSQPNIFERFTDVIAPKSKKEQSRDPFSDILNRMVDVVDPKTKEAEDAKDPITDIFYRVVDMINPKTKEETKDPITNIFERVTDVIQPQSKERSSQSSIGDIFRRIGDVITPQKREVKSESPVKVNSGNVGKIKIINRFLRSPVQVLAKISELRHRFLPGQREKRSDLKGPYNTTLALANQLKVHKLKVQNLIYAGDIVKGFSINHTSPTIPMLSINRKIKTHLLNVTELKAPSNIRGSRQYVPDLYYGLTPSIRAKHLQVTSVNGLPWTEFYEEIFLKNRDSTITGRLVLQSQVEVDHLKTVTLNHLVVDNLFNLVQSQVVNSQLLISRFFVHNLQADSVNGLKFEDDIVFSGREAYVETPVTMHHLSISGDLIVADKKIERFSQNSDEMEFKQFYTNKVVINGTLVLSNVRRDNENISKIEIGEEEFREEIIKERYLLKTEEQAFNFPIAFDNGKVVAPSLETLYLNDHLTEDHMLIDKVNSSKPLLIVFMKANVPGDIICSDYKSKIAEIQENIIRPGDVATITGKKRFEAPLVTDDVQTLQLNHLPVSDLIFKPELDLEIKFHDLKRFEKIIVRNPCFVEKGIEAMHLNNLPLEDLLNHDYHLEYIYVPHTLMASNVVFHKINGIPFDEFFTKLNIDNDQLILRKDLIVEGNVLFADPLELKYINNLEWNAYVANLARNNENTIIDGNICFQGDLTITDELLATEANNYNLQDIFNNILLKSKPQLITGQYTFENLKVSNLDVLSINDKPLKEFIDLSNNYTEFAGDLIAPKVEVEGNLKGVLENSWDFDNLSEKIKELSKKSWRNLKVLGNVSWSSNQTEINTQQELLKYLYKYAVKSNQNQVITGNVKLMSPLIRKMQTRLQFPANIDLGFIERDAVNKNSSFAEKIKGRKIFLNPIFTEQMEALKDIQSSFVNNIDISLLNASLYRLSSKTPLQGPLKFLQPLSIGHMSLKGLINGLNTSFIYQIKNNSVLPPVVVKQLFVDNNIQLKNINHMHLEYFLDNRVTLNGPALEVFGFLTFENVIIEKAALVQTINNIHIDNMVFKHSAQLQTITGHKSVAGSLELAGPAHVMRVNNKDLMEIYRQTIFTDRNYQFDNLIIHKATFEKGLNVLSSQMSQRSFPDTEQLEGQNFKKLLETVDEQLTSNSGHIMYLDYDEKTKVKWQKTDSNSSVDKIVLKEISRISCCEKQFLKISYAKGGHEMLLENITSNRLSTFSDNVAVKVENYCKFKYRKVKSKISISATKVLKVFGLKRFVETIQIMTLDKQKQQFVILHALDLPALKRNEVRLFKIDNLNNSIEDWQGLTQNIGEKLKVFQLPRLTSLITNGLVDHHPALTIYHFEESLQKFKLRQIIDGDYDIIEMLSLHNDSYEQLIISCHKCQRIFIYEYAPQEEQPNYQIFQMLSLKTNIDKLFLFSIRKDNYMLVISESDSSYYHLYKYAYIRGWLPITYGIYPNLQMSIPLTETSNELTSFEILDNTDSIALMILCNLENCHLVNAIVQK